MKALKLLIFLAIVGGGGYFAYTHFLRPPEKTICARFATLCGGKDANAKTLKSCEAAVHKLAEVAGDKAIHKVEACIAEVDTCPKATGCVFGAGLNVLGDVFKGMQKAIEK